jgi:hypothetical protein
MESINNIHFHQFFSYIDENGFIYGCDISSLYNLCIHSKSIQNPYTRNVIPNMVINKIQSIMTLANILKITIMLKYKEDKVSEEKEVEFRALKLFQTIDSLGNYSDYKWFLTLNKDQLIVYIKELYDIWNYRAQITDELKHDICPPYGNPFRHSNICYYVSIENNNILNCKKYILEVLEKFINNGINKDAKTLGAYYILGALTIVNESARSSLPWLFQSFGHF